MAFRYDWNIEVLARFHATYFYKYDTDEIHWMIEGRHYRVDFTTYSRILGFDEEHRGFSYIHDEKRAEVREIAFMYLDGRATDGKAKGLKSFYYILNNLIRHTIIPKDGAASNLNGYVRNVLARFALGGDKFNVPRFMWQEIRVSMDDARKGLPYALYLMFVLERVTGYRFVKDGLYEQYKIEKARHAKASETIASPSNVPESSRSGRKKKKKKNKMV
jgi:hypothetical protein